MEIWKVIAVSGHFATLQSEVDPIRTIAVSVQVEEPLVARFIAQLKPGDRVELDPRTNQPLRKV